MSLFAPAEGLDLLASAQWRLASTDAGSVTDPADLPADLDWFDAIVPGTVASALGFRDDIDDLDWWYVTEVGTAGLGPDLRLRFGGIATHAQIWIDGAYRAAGASMFVPETLELTGCADTVSIAIRVESLAAKLKSRRPRGRWRSSLVAAQGLRHERTTMLGRAPVYGPLPVPVGPWRPITLTAPPVVSGVRLSASVSGSDGVLRVRAEIRAELRGASCVRIHFDHNVIDVNDALVDHAVNVPDALVDHAVNVPDALVDHAVIDVNDALVDHAAIDVEKVILDHTLTIPDVDLWWPHTHGRPRTYSVSIEVDGIAHDVGRVGFRTAQLDRSAGHVTLKVNGENIFCRGGTWTPLDPVRLWSPADELRTVLERVRGAGLNMVRIVGTLVYEQPEFWSVCAELGIMVWQDVMIGTFDPPDDAGYSAMVSSELDALADEVAGNPALVVVSGGSETQQQPTMLGIGLEEQRMTLLDNVIPAKLQTALPGVAYVTSTPSGLDGSDGLNGLDSSNGELHTHVGDGIAHYFGVGGYLRPLSDIRTAAVKFAAECLAFAVPPERASVDRFFGSANVAGHQPDWKAAVPRDRGSSWDFEDVRDHYVRMLFDIDPHLVRRDDAELYLDYGRAAIVEAFTAGFGHWRRAASGCGGALVLTLRDTVPGAGWGISDSTGAPKAPWYALARASATVALLLSDNGLDGYSVELVNDGPDLAGVVRVVLHSAAGSQAHDRQVTVSARSSAEWTVDSIVGSFTDANHAYRFGSRTYSAITVTLLDASGSEVTRATTLIGPQSRQNTVGLKAEVAERSDGVWELTVDSEWAAQFVCIDVDGFDVSDSWFHLAPNEPRTVTLVGSGKPRGHVRALNSIKRAPVAPAVTDS